MSASLKRLAEAPWFHRLMVGVILAAGIIVGLETNRDLMQRFGPLLHALDQIILALFIIELVVRLGAYGRRFFHDPWNVFDFAVVAICLLPLHAEYAAVLRLVRVLRLLRLVTALPRLQMLVGALLHSLSSMGYVGLLLLLMLYVYGVMGVFLFGASSPEHFGSLGSAMLALFQVITLEGWVEIMRAQFPPPGAGSGASTFAVFVYFISFILLGTMIMLNLFIGVIMNGMAEFQAKAEKSSTRPRDELHEIVLQLGELQRRLAVLDLRGRASGRDGEMEQPNASPHAAAATGTRV